MGPREIGHRVGELAGMQWLRWQYLRGLPLRSLAPDPGGGVAFAEAADAQLPEPYCAFRLDDPVVGDLLQGRLTVLGHPWQWSQAAEVWRRAPDTGALWPQRFFGSIPYRAGNPYGDVRIAWEPSRLQWLVGLALVARAATDERRRIAIALLEEAFLSWVSANPPLAGIHYISAMECALRLIAACHALDLARPHLVRRAEVFRALVALAGSHAVLIERRLSLYSSAGNHTIAEAAGLVYAGTLFTELPAAARWKRRGLQLLEAEMPRQVLDDGGGLEQSFSYLRFITELAELVVALLRHRDEAPPAGLVDRTVRARRFLHAVADEAGKLPAVGDSDDGHALCPWYRAPETATPPPAPCRTLPVSGYSLLRAHGPPPLRILFDHGPLGMPPAFAHGHADALSILLWQGQSEVLAETGTFTYTGPPQWRRYFRSTAAHNTVMIDGADQAHQVSAFMWSAPFRCELLKAEEQGGVCRMLARHDGYRRRGIVHWRGLSVRPDGRLLVWDHIAGSGRHAATLSWHIAVPVQAESDRWRLGASLILEIEGAQAVRCHIAGEPPLGGWRSAAYGRKEPITALRAEHIGPLPCQFLSRLSPSGLDMPRELVAQDLAVFRRWMA